MVNSKDLMFLPDLFKLKKSYLEPIALDYGIDPTQDIATISTGVWDVITCSPENRSNVFDRISSYIFAGKTSVSWYLFPNARECFNPQTFPQHVSEIDDRLITSTPTLIGMARIEEDVYLLRYVVKTGIIKQVTGFNVTTTPKSSIISVIVDLEDGFVELRTDPKTAKKTIQVLSTSLGNDASLIHFENFTDETLERLVDELDGKLVETLSFPESEIEDISQEQVHGVIQVLESITDFFATSDTDQLTDSLSTLEVACTGIDLASIPFANLILVGMNKLGMCTINGDLREQALFSLLRPHISYRRGFIEFPLSVNGITETHTIRVGLDSKSIYFNSASNDYVIKAVREKLLRL